MMYCMHCMEPLQEGQTLCSHCHKPAQAEIPPHHLKPGTVMRDKYMVGSALGEGGFGITYIGRDLTLDMRIAIKEYYPNGYSNRNHNYSNTVTLNQSGKGEDFQRNMQRFLHEARILAKFCNEPNIVGVRDFFQENGTAYIIMDFLDGVTLKEYLRHNGTIPANVLFPMMYPVMTALGKIHEQGLIHRDISPDNLMLLKNGQLKLLDFGAAREVGENKSLSVMLKRGYAPEEQYRTRGKQGPWTDVYALCATMYKCVTGITPDESMQRIFDDELKKPSELGVVMPAACENMLMQGLNIKAADRPQSMAELRMGLVSSISEGTRNVDFYFNNDDSRTVMQGSGEAAKLTEKIEKSVPKEDNLTAAEDDEKTQYTVRETEVLREPEVLSADLSKQHTEQNGTAKAADTIGKQTNQTGSGGKIAEKTRMVEGFTASKIKPVHILLAVGVLAILVALGLLLLGGSGKPEVSLEDTLPTERSMAGACSSVLKEEGISGSVIDLTVQDETLNEKFKTYIVNCQVTVSEGGTSAEYTLTLHYEYNEDSWELSDLSAIQ